MMMPDAALLLVVLLTSRGPIYARSEIVEHCQAVAAGIRAASAARMGVDRALRGWSVRASCSRLSVLPAPAEGLGR